MKKFFMYAFAATALLFGAAACTDDDDATGDGNVPENLTGVWVPENEALTAVITVGNTMDNRASVTAEFPVQGLQEIVRIDDSVMYDATTGKGYVVGNVELPITDEFKQAMGWNTKQVTVNIQGIGANRINVEIALVGSSTHLLKKNFKRNSTNPADRENITIVPETPAQPSDSTDVQPSDSSRAGIPEVATGVYSCTKTFTLPVAGSAKATLTLGEPIYSAAALNAYYPFTITLSELSESLQNVLVGVNDTYRGVIEYDATTGVFTYNADLIRNQYPDYAEYVDVIKALRINFTDLDHIHVYFTIDASEYVQEEYKNAMSNFQLLNDDFVRAQ